MCSKATACDVGWAEALPEKCPRDRDQDPTGQTLYRWFDKTKAAPDASDFLSHEAMGLLRFPNACPCERRAVSMFGSLQYLRTSGRLRSVRDKKKFARITLMAGHGVVSPPDAKTHVSWWRCGGHDPVQTASVVLETDAA